jgi:hypothetical protein
LLVRVLVIVIEGLAMTVEPEREVNGRAVCSDMRRPNAGL